MNKFQKIVLLLLVILLVGCSQEFVIEENTKVIQENISNNSNIKLQEAQIEKDIYKEIEIENIEEKNISNESLEKITFSSSLDSLIFKLDKEYSLEIGTQENIFSYSFLVKETDGGYDSFINGVAIPTSVLSVYFNVENKEISFEKLGDNKIKLSFKEKEDNKDHVEEEEIEIELEVDIEDNSIELEWEDTINGVKWYKVMHSVYNNNPKYPQDNAIAVIEKGKKQEFEHLNPSEGVNYYRISVVLEDDYIVHSEVVEVNFKYDHKEDEISCEGPYKLLTEDNRCIWSCSQGTTPNFETNTCECKEGYEKTGEDEFDRKICEEVIIEND